MDLRESTGNWHDDRTFIGTDATKGVVLGVEREFLFVLAYDAGNVARGEKGTYGIYANPKGKISFDGTLVWHGESFGFSDFVNWTGICLDDDAADEEWNKLYSDMDLVMSKATTDDINDGWQLVEAAKPWKTNHDHLLYHRFAGVVLGEEEGVLFVLKNSGVGGYRLSPAKSSDGVLAFGWKERKYEWCESTHDIVIESSADWEHVYSNVDKIKEGFFKHEQRSAQSIHPPSA